jgi:hypothetical protein
MKPGLQYWRMPAIINWAFIKLIWKRSWAKGLNGKVKPRNPKPFDIN